MELRPASLHYCSPTMLLMLCSRPGTLHDFHSHEIAEQLTLLDAELFYKIEVGAEWPCEGKQLSVLGRAPAPGPGPSQAELPSPLFPPRSLRSCFGPKSRMRRRAPI